MNTISLKMPDPLAAELAEMAQRRGVSKSALIREALGGVPANGRSRTIRLCPIAGGRSQGHTFRA